jgi:hypothetical protein
MEVADIEQLKKSRQNPQFPSAARLRTAVPTVRTIKPWFAIRKERIKGRISD